MDTEPTKLEVIEHRKDIEFIKALLLDLKEQNEKDHKFFSRKNDADHARIMQRQSDILEDIFGNGGLGLKTKISIMWYVVTVVILPGLGAVAFFLFRI